jgi:NADH-quinone oxidoreductase subunit L
MAGIVTAWLFTARYPAWSEMFVNRFKGLHRILVNKYGFDEFNQTVLVQGTQDTGHLFYDVSDVKLIDGVCVNGSAHFIRWFAQTARRFQTGYIYQYALVMMLGVVAMLAWYLGGF